MFTWKQVANVVIHVGLTVVLVSLLHKHIEESFDWFAKKFDGGA
jgi:hypothetical protein